jgi:hypothetical protein
VELSTAAACVLPPLAAPKAALVLYAPDSSRAVRHMPAAPHRRASSARIVAGHARANTMATAPATDAQIRPETGSPEPFWYPNCKLMEVGQSMQFMTEQLAPVYDNSEALVAAVAYRSANVPHRAQLFRKDPLNRALNALGDAFRPRRRRSLDEAIKETDKYIEVTEKRLQYLMDIRAHAQILRGAVRSAEGPKRSWSDIVSEDQKIEADFAAAIENETSRLAAAELRGLFRTRLGNLSGALEDFRRMQDSAQDLYCILGHARALRHQADTLRKQAAGQNATLLRRARRILNIADHLFDGRTLGLDDWCERGHNRESYGEVQADLATIAGTSKNPATTAFNAAISHFQLAGAGCSADCNRVRERIARL